jgi:hypothetical protein
MRKTFQILIITLILSFLGSLFLVKILAWQEPTTAPPGGNVPAPLNVGPQAQTKLGDLNIGSGLAYWITKLGNSFALKNNANQIKFIIGQDGNVGIGTTNPTEKLDVAGNIQLNANQAKGMRLENVPSHPTSCDTSKIGYIYYNTTLDQFCLCQKTGWSCKEPPKTTDKLVFVTSTLHDGALGFGRQGGLPEADSICNARAAAAGIGRTFRAWLSGYPNYHARERIKCSDTKRYVMWNSEKWKYEIIADSCSDLIDGTLDHPIDRDEYGLYIPPSHVWTGTDRYGLHTSSISDDDFHNCTCSGCVGWTFDYPYRGGICGSSTATNLEWTQRGRCTCNMFNRLYCFEI